MASSVVLNLSRDIQTWQSHCPPELPPSLNVRWVFALSATCNVSNAESFDVVVSELLASASLLRAKMFSQSNSIQSAPMVLSCYEKDSIEL
jgi:hypothetical protein